MSHVKLREVIVGDVVFVVPAEWKVSRKGNLIKVISPDEEMEVLIVLDTTDLDILFKNLPGPKVIHGNIVKWDGVTGKFGIERVGGLQFSWLYYSKEDITRVEGILKTVVKTLRRRFISMTSLPSMVNTPMPLIFTPPQYWIPPSLTQNLMVLMMLAHQRFINNMIFWDTLSEIRHRGEMFRMFRDTMNYISRLRMKEWEDTVREWESYE